MKLKSHILTLLVLSGLTAGALSLRAEDHDMSKMPGMSQGDLARQTNAPDGFTNAPVKPYPLKYCVVSGDKIGDDMGKPVTNYYKGRQIIFCCKDCVKDFKKDPDKYLKKFRTPWPKASWRKSK